jgi:hypothetical protein
MLVKGPRATTASRVGCYRVDNFPDCILLFNSSVERHKSLIAQPVVSMEPIRKFILAHERLCSALINGNVLTTQLLDVKNVGSRLLNADVARNGGNSGNANTWSAHRHNQS